jgi:hypothetical protein
MERARAVGTRGVAGFGGPAALAVALAVGYSGCHHVAHPGPHDLVRYRGPVRLALTAVAVAPGKADGRPWDGPGQLPAQVVDGLRAPLSRSLLGSVFGALSRGGVVGALVNLLPWTANAFISGMAAPDVQVELSLNGKLLARSAMVSNSFFPTWTDVYTGPLTLNDYDQIELKAIDRDVLFHDQIGVCTSQGMPWVDSHHGYASAQTFQCFGQLWAVALRVIPLAKADAAVAEIAIAAEQDGD